jgi:hypothetical protein
VISPYRQQNLEDTLASRQGVNFKKVGILEKSSMAESTLFFLEFIN